MLIIFIQFPTTNGSRVFYISVNLHSDHDNEDEGGGGGDVVDNHDDDQIYPPVLWQSMQ